MDRSSTACGIIVRICNFVVFHNLLRVLEKRLQTEGCLFTVTLLGPSVAGHFATRFRGTVVLLPSQIFVGSEENGSREKDASLLLPLLEPLFFCNML